MNREQAKWVVFNSIKKKLKKLEPIDDLQKLFDKETWRKNFIDWLYDNGFVLIAPPGIEFEEDVPKSKFMEEWWKILESDTSHQDTLSRLAELIVKYKADKTGEAKNE